MCFFQGACSRTNKHSTTVAELQIESESRGWAEPSNSPGLQLQCRKDGAVFSVLYKQSVKIKEKWGRKSPTANNQTSPKLTLSQSRSTYSSRVTAREELQTRGYLFTECATFLGAIQTRDGFGHHLPGNPGALKCSGAVAPRSGCSQPTHKHARSVCVFSSPVQQLVTTLVTTQPHSGLYHPSLLQAK